ncbi:unnamed protein product [Microthlaspi erraticum]|uniref:Retrotransposon gag domain-containing protein n=1 Tax=Microthlaspi erraticum TaxID=1685480 RepID=A0A6D2HZX9_9BRAS|nr:unnamed protein product [Microthlaspi erraticum]
MTQRRLDKLEKQLRKQKPKRWPTKQLALTPLKWRALNEEGRDPPPPPPNPAGDVNAQPQAEHLQSETMTLPMLSSWIETLSIHHFLQGMTMRSSLRSLHCTTRSNGVSADYLKCKLFSFSLGDKASRWLKSLPAHSITTWDEYKAAFINHFYTKQRSISVRNKISTFAKPTMSLSMRR